MTTNNTSTNTLPTICAQTLSDDPMQAFHIRKETTSIMSRALFILWRMWESCTKMSKQENIQKSKHSQ